MQLICFVTLLAVQGWFLASMPETVSLLIEELLGWYEHVHTAMSRNEIDPFCGANLDDLVEITRAWLTMVLTVATSRMPWVC